MDVAKQHDVCFVGAIHGIRARIVDTIEEKRGQGHLLWLWLAKRSDCDH